jgi:hypothetical protein
MVGDSDNSPKRSGSMHDGRPITPHKSLAPYRECRRRKSWHNGRNSGRGTFDRGDLKEVADSTRYGATIGSLCNEVLAEGLMALREGNSALHCAATRPEDITPAAAVAGGHFVQVGLASSLGVRHNRQGSVQRWRT